MGLVASSVVMTVIVLNIHHQPIKSRRLVHLLRDAAPFLFLARLLCVGRPVKTPKKFSKINSLAYQMKPSLNGLAAKERQPISQLADTYFSNRMNHNHSSAKNPPQLNLVQNKGSLSDLSQSCTDDCGYPSLNSHFNGDVKSFPKQNNKSVHMGEIRNRTGNPRILVSDEEEAVSEHELELIKCLQLLQDIKDRLTREQSKDLEKEYQKYIKEEWRYLARVVDRLLGLCYVLTFIALIIAFS